MKSRLSLLTLSLVLLALLVSAPFSSLQAAQTRPVEKLVYPQLNSFVLPEIQKDETGNGIKLRLIKDDKLPIIQLSIMLKGGDVYDPQGKTGLASATSQLLRIGGTKDISPDELDKMLDSNGISIDFFASKDNFSINLSCLQEKLDQALGLLAKMVMEPAFNPEKLEEIKAQGSSAISRRNDEPRSILERESAKLIYGANSPFARVIEYETIDSITKEDIAVLHQKFFAPNNMLTGVTGPIEMAELKGLMEKHFGSWKASASVPAFPEVKEQNHDYKVAFMEKAGLNQTYISIAHLGIKEDLAEKAKIRLFNSIFGQGFSSRLVLRIRVKMGSTYGVTGSIGSEYLYPGLTFAGTFTKSESTVDVVKAMLEEIDIIRREKVSAKELEEAKTFFLDSFVFNYSSPERILNAMLDKEFYGIPLDADQKLLEDIKKVTADDILATAQKYITPEKLLIMVVGSKATIKPELSVLGTVKDIDVSIKQPELKEKIPAATPESLAKGQAVINAMLAKAYKDFPKFKSLTVEGSMQMSIQGQNFTMGLKSTQLFPGKQHVEITVMGMKMLQIVNGDKGIRDQMGNKMPIPPDEIEKENFGELYNMFTKKNVYSFQYLKEEQIEGKTYDVLYIFDAKKNWVKFYVNKANQYLEIEESLANVPGASGIMRKVSSDFKVIAGVPFAFKQVASSNGKVVQEITLSKVEANVKVDPAIFTINQ